MRIERIHVTGFNRTRGLDLALDPGLTVITGPNGAGKSTLAEAIRSILFGFGPARPARQPDGTPTGGWIEARLGDGRLVRIDRHADRPADRQLAVSVDGHPSADPAAELARVLGPVDRDTFEAIFAFGLDDLTGLGRTPTERIIDEVLGPAVGPHAALAAVEATLDATRDASGSPDAIATLVRRLDDLDARLVAADPPRRYRAAREAGDAAEQERAALDRRLDALNEERRAADRLARAIPHVRALAAAEDAIAATGPATALDRIMPLVADARGRVIGAERGIAVAQVALDQAVAHRDALPAPDPALLAARPRIEELRAALVHREAQDRRLDGLRRELEAADADARRVALGAGDWCTPAWIVAHGPIAELRATLRSRAEALLETPARRADAARERVAAAGDALAVARAALEAAPEPIPASGLTANDLRASIEAAERAQRDLDAAVAVRDALAALPAPAVRRPSRLSDPRLGLLLVTLVALAGAGVALVRGPSVLPATVPATWAAIAWIAAVLFAGLVLVRIQVLHRRRNARERAEASGSTMSAGERGKAAEEAILAATAARREAYATLNVAIVGDLDGPRERVRALEREEAAREAARVRHAAAAAAVAEREADHAAAEAVLRDAEEEVAAGLAAWRGLLEAEGLPGDLDGWRVEGVLDAAREARVRLDRAAGVRAELERAERDAAAWVEQARAVLAPLGIDAADMTAAVAQAAAAADAVARADGVRHDAETGVERAVAALAAARAEAEACRAAYAALLTAEGFADETALAAAQDRAKERSVHAARRDAERAALAAIAGNAEAPDALALRATGADPDAARAAVAAVSERIAAAERERASAIARLGASRATIEELERETTTSELRAEREAVLARLRAIVRDHLVGAAGGGLVREARRRFDEANRPALLAAAERWFLAWTGGEYEALLTPEGRAASGARRADGDVTAMTQLSRGTREQLYLALRFGLIDHLAEGREPLPLLMDEVLVDFDAERLPRVRAAIEAMAARRQVIYLTFHADGHGLGGRHITLPRR